MTPLTMGLDLGTASSKGVLVTPEGSVVASAVRPHSMSMPRPGWAEVDAEAIWWADVVALASELAGRTEGRPIAGLCVSGVGPCLLVCDAEHLPLRPAILYGIDMRASIEIEDLTHRYGIEQIVERGGSALSSQAVGPKMLWLQRHEPDVWSRAAVWHNSHSFAVARLTGEYVLDHHTASQCDPLYDIAAFDWNHRWASEIAPGVALPRLSWPGEVVGSISSAAAAETGLSAGTPVVAGTVDAWAEAFSVGVRKPADVMLMYGSTMFVVQVLPDLQTSPLLWTTAGVEPRSYSFAAGMATSGSLTAWVQQLTGGGAFEDLVREAAATPPGADGLLVLPYFAGERTPIFDPRARGVIAGLSLRHERGHLFRAVYEGIAFGARQILELFATAGGGPVHSMVAVGGGTQGRLWTQIVSDVTGIEQRVPQETIGACYGDALLAAIGVGLVAPETDWTKDAATVRPNDHNRGVYDELFHAYETLYPATIDQVHTLADLQDHPSTDDVKGSGNDGSSCAPTRVD
jgi:xylulokinase